MIGRRHQEFERYFKSLDDFPRIKRKREPRFHPRHGRQNAKSGKRQIKIEIADRLDQIRREPDFFSGFAYRRGDGTGIAGINLAPGKSNLSGMARELSRSQ